MISVGIDTGGTYTDAVAIDQDSGEILAKGKYPTTKEDLSICIEGALACLPEELLLQAETITLSTTLATNACVENKGSAAKLILIGVVEDMLDRIDAFREFGIVSSNVLCVDSKSSFDGRVVDHPDWEKVLAENTDWFDDTDALAIAAVFAINNGGACEKLAKEFFEERLGVPIVTASELVSDLNVFERGSTAMLNARLLNLVRDFIKTVELSLERREVGARSFVVRSDGSLMSHSLAHRRPVDTILSGPAASVLGGCRLAGSENCLIIDMGGTTTDISIVKDGAPKMASEGIRIGGWNTQIQGVYVDTFALGGDSGVRIEEGKLALSNRRVVPFCTAAMKWPEVKDGLRSLLTNKKTYYRGYHEFLYLVQDSDKISNLTSEEAQLIELLRSGPRMIDSFELDEGISKYRLNCDRLEMAGVVMRCGLTPTDMMHIRGDYGTFDREASELAARFYMRSMPDDFEGKTVEDFADAVYEIVCKKLYENVVRILLADRLPGAFANGLDRQMEQLISDSWNGDGRSLLHLGFETPATLVGVGAPTHVFLPRVAEFLGAKCAIPKHAEVANAIGAVSADIRVSVRVEINEIPGLGFPLGYTVHSQSGVVSVKTLDEARAAALKAAEEDALSEARRRGALGALRAEVHMDASRVVTPEGKNVTFGHFALATVTDRIFG